MRRTIVGYEPRSDWHIRFLGVPLRHPHDVGTQARVGLLREQRLLDSGDPPETCPSRWGCEHDDSHLSRVRVERGAKRFKR